MPTDTAPSLASVFSATRPPDAVKQACASAGRKVVRVEWSKPFVRCSDNVELIGTTANYPDGETIPVGIWDRGGTKQEIQTGPATVAGNGFRAPWTVKDVLPVRAGSGGYIRFREVDGRADLARTARALPVTFIPNIAEIGARGIEIKYDRTNPKVDATATTPEIPEEKTTVSMYTWFSLEVKNYVIRVKGKLEYVRGWAREFVELPDPQPPGGFAFGKKTVHWGIQNKIDLTWTYWDGTAWKPTPTAYHSGDGNHFSASFYHNGTEWICREDAAVKWPMPFPEWPKAVYEGPGNRLGNILNTWKKEIESAWSDQFDIKRLKCQSSLEECCRYRVVCEVAFTETKELKPGVLVVTYENVRSNATLWAGGDERVGLASHEFGHLLGAPDEYADVFSTQLGVTDDDGLKDGLDPDGIMGKGLKGVKKRHFKGIVEAMRLAVELSYSLNYTYAAVPRGKTLALPVDVAVEPDPAPSPVLAEPDPGGGVDPWKVMGGAVAGALVGAAAGYLASGGKNDWATGGSAAVGALVGGAVGWFI
jgi:hypothetical protein